jgi:2-keto-4-pentenoate hydratase
LSTLPPQRHARVVADRDLAAIEATLEVGPPGGESDSVTGAGDAVLGHPARAVAWCAAALQAVAGETISAGEIVLPGAMARALPIAPGHVVRATFTELGVVEAKVV